MLFSFRATIVYTIISCNLLKGVVVNPSVSRPDPNSSTNQLERPSINSHAPRSFRKAVRSVAEPLKDHSIEANVGNVPTEVPPSVASTQGSLSSQSGHSAEDHAAHTAIHAPAIFFITFTLAMGALAMMVIHTLEHYVIIPYTVVCLILGCFYGVLSLTWPELSPFTVIAQTNPEVFLLVFLPILIYESAFCMQTHLFKKLTIHMLIIGTVGMGLSFISIAFISQQLLSTAVKEFTLTAGLVFSATVSAIDPVPAIPILEESGSAKTLTIVLEGTSLFSEATSIVLFNFFTKMMDTTTTVDGLTEFWEILRVILGGPAWGLLVAVVLTQVLSHMTNMWEAELICILSTPFITFWCADAAFKTSGALAVLVLGLWMSAHRAVMSPEVESMIHRIWEFLSVIADTLIYSIFGVLIIETILKQDITNDDWWMSLVISVAVVAVRGVVFCLMQPVLFRIGFGNKVFTWPHIFVLVWGGFRGAVTLTLGLMASKSQYTRHHPEVASKIVFHSVGVVAFTLLVNASTMRFLLKKLGVLDLPLAKIISMNIAMQYLAERQQEDIAILTTDRYMTDTDWNMVQHSTTLEQHDFGDDESDKFRILSMHYQARESKVCLNCAEGEKITLLPEEISEMEGIARVRLVQAKKISYWKQFEEGTLSQRGVEHLDDLTDIVLHNDSGILGADDIVHYLRNERWTGLKLQLAAFQRWVASMHFKAFGPPTQPWRVPCYKVAISDYFEWFMYGIITINVTETIVDWAASGSTIDISWLGLLFLYTNLVFMMFYTAEAIIKIIGMRWIVYWGRSWCNWNRLDLCLLVVTYVDLSLSFAAEYGDTLQGNTIKGPIPERVIIFFRFFRLVRFARLVKLIKPAAPFILAFFDERVNSHLFFSYDVARAFIIGQEETDLILPTLIGFKPLIAKIKAMTEADATVISKEIGLMNERRPDVAAAVKTRQAARCVLNGIIHTIGKMRKKGILDEHNVAHLMMDIEEKLKELRHFPHSILVLGGRERLWNVPWINGNRELCEVMKTLFVEKKFKRGEKIAISGAQADGIYFIVNGVVFLDFPQVTIDNELGEIYDSDNFEVTFDHVGKDISLRSDYVSPGSILNVQSALLGMSRRSDAICETAVAALFLDTATLIKTMTQMPALESRIWRRIAVCVSLNILIKLGVLVDSSTEEERIRLSRGAVRLIRKGVHLLGLDQFSETFLISGTVQEMSTKSRDILVAPRKIPAAFRELQIVAGQPALVNEANQEVYPSYAIILVVPPGDQDISTINVHDSQLTVMTDMNTNQTIKTTAGRGSKTMQNGPSASPSSSPMGARKASNVGEIVAFAKEEKRRRSTVTYHGVLDSRHR